MLLINNIKINTHRIDRKLSKSIMLFKVKINIVRNRTIKVKIAERITC